MQKSADRPLAKSDSDVLDGYIEEDAFAVDMGRKPRTVKHWRQMGEGPPYVKIGGKVLYHRDAIRKWLHDRTVQPAS